MSEIDLRCTVWIVTCHIQHLGWTEVDVVSAGINECECAKLNVVRAYCLGPGVDACASVQG